MKLSDLIAGCWPCLLRCLLRGEDLVCGLTSLLPAGWAEARSLAPWPHQRLRVSLAFRCGYRVPPALACSCRGSSRHRATILPPACSPLAQHSDPVPAQGLPGSTCTPGSCSAGHWGALWLQTCPGLRKPWAVPRLWRLALGDGAESPHPEPLGTAGGPAPSSLALPLQAPLLPSPSPWHGLLCPSGRFLACGVTQGRADSGQHGHGAQGPLCCQARGVCVCVCVCTPRLESPFASCLHTTQPGKQPLGHSVPQRPPSPGPRATGTWQCVSM